MKQVSLHLSHYKMFAKFSPKDMWADPELHTAYNLVLNRLTLKKEVPSSFDVSSPE